MSAIPKTIQIFLPGGDPQGIRIAEITTRIVQIIEVPRSLLNAFLAMPESEQVALYFLFGQSEDGSEQRVYIGQTGDLRLRLASHNKKKDFWERAIILISRTNSLTQTHALFLEWHCLQEAKVADRYIAENGNAGSKAYTPPPLQADCMEIFDTGKTLLATLGYPLFEAVVKQTERSNTHDIFYCKGSGSDGRGLYTEEGFVVLKGSFGRKDNVTSVGPGVRGQREKLTNSGVLQIEGDKLVFTKDHLFRSPSIAAGTLMGRTANGWIEWKDGDGATLDALKRETGI
jgi:hypothetical protein